MSRPRRFGEIPGLVPFENHEELVEDNKEMDEESINVDFERFQLPKHTFLKRSSSFWDEVAVVDQASILHEERKFGEIQGLKRRINPAMFVPPQIRATPSNLRRPMFSTESQRYQSTISIDPVKPRDMSNVDRPVSPWEYGEFPYEDVEVEEETRQRKRKECIHRYQEEAKLFNPVDAKKLDLQ